MAADVGEERPRWASWAGIVTWWFVAVAAVLGLRHVAAAPRRVLLAPVVSVAITTVLFYGGHRIRAPMEPVVAVLAGVWIAARVVGSPGRPVSEPDDGAGRVGEGAVVA